MVLLIIALAGAVGMAGTLALLELGWRRTSPRDAIRPTNPHDLAEDRELELTSALLAGRIDAGRYRAELAELAGADAAEPQLHGRP